MRAAAYAVATVRLMRAMAERWGVTPLNWRPALRSTTPNTPAVPPRRHSVSRLAACPGRAGRGARASAFSGTGLSSRHTKGSSAREGRSSSASTFSVRVRQAAPSSARHHIYFQPRLEVVALQQRPDRFPPHVRNDLAFDHFLREQADRPPRGAGRRIGPREDDDALLVDVREDSRGAGARSLIERRVDAIGAIALRNIAHGFAGTDARRSRRAAHSRRDPTPRPQAPAGARGRAAPHPGAGRPASAGRPVPSETGGRSGHPPVHVARTDRAILFGNSSCGRCPTACAVTMFCASASTAAAPAVASVTPVLVAILALAMSEGLHWRKPPAGRRRIRRMHGQSRAEFRIVVLRFRDAPEFCGREIRLIRHGSCRAMARAHGGGAASSLEDFSAVSLPSIAMISGRISPLASQIEVTAANKCAMSSPSVPTRCPITAERGERRMLVARARDRALIRQHARVRDQDELEQHGARASAPAVSFRNFALYRVRSIASSSMWFSGRSNRPRTICRAQSASSSADRLASWQSGARRCAVQGADSTCEAVVNVSRSGARRGAPATTSS